jgi:hypothetical protein
MFGKGTGTEREREFVFENRNVNGDVKNYIFRNVPTLLHRTFKTREVHADSCKAAMKIIRFRNE